MVSTKNEMKAEMVKIQNLFLVWEERFKRLETVEKQCEEVEQVVKGLRSEFEKNGDNQISRKRAHEGEVDNAEVGIAHNGKQFQGQRPRHLQKRMKNDT